MKGVGQIRTEIIELIDELVEFEKMEVQVDRYEKQVRGKIYL